MSYMCVSLLFFETHSLFKFENASVNVQPVATGCGILCEKVAGKYAVPRGILNVNVEVCALHRYDDVKIYL